MTTKFQFSSANSNVNISLRSEIRRQIHKIYMNTALRNFNSLLPSCPNSKMT